MAWLLRAALVACILAAVCGSTAAESPALDKREIEKFLQTAKVVHREALARGVTHSDKVTLSDESRTFKAVWKTIDKSQPIQRFSSGLPELGFIDSYKNEIAAYELDKLLELDMVPPTVPRRIGRQQGSLQLWIDDCMSEAERFQSGVQPPDTEAWRRQVFKDRVFRQLIYDTDYKNASNVLVDPDFRIWSVDHSRSFRLQEALLDSDYILRFSRALLGRLEGLDGDTLERALGPWTSKAQRQAILARRDLLLARAAELVAERGAEAVLYP